MSNEQMNQESGNLRDIFDGALAGIGRTRNTFAPQLTPREVGRITSLSTGIARVAGLPGVGSEELVKFQGGVHGIAFNVDADEVGVVLLGDYTQLDHHVPSARGHDRPYV